MSAVVRLRIRSEPAEDCSTVQRRQIQVEKYDIRPFLLDRTEGCIAISSPETVYSAKPEGRAIKVRELSIIFDDENSSPENHGNISAA